MLVEWKLEVMELTNPVLPTFRTAELFSPRKERKVSKVSQAAGQRFGHISTYYVKQVAINRLMGLYEIAGQPAESISLTVV